MKTGWKIAVVMIAFVAAIIAFMLKLPKPFRGIDKEMHTLFYFLAAAFLNLLFAKKNLLIHCIIFALLYSFGAVIEHAQAYSNQYFGKKIHGRYDPEDVAANLKGLIIFSSIWVPVIIGRLIFGKRSRPENIDTA